MQFGARCRVCGTDALLCYLQCTRELAVAGMIDPERCLPGMRLEPLIAYLDDGSTIHALEGLTTMCSASELRAAIVRDAGATLRDLDYRSYWSGRILCIGRRAIRVDTHTRHSYWQAPDRLAFTADEVAAFGTPPVAVLTMVAMTDPECPPRSTTNVDGLRPPTIACCVECSGALGHRLSVLRVPP